MKKRCILLGGGSSVKELIDNDLWNKIRKEEIWSINFGFMIMPYTPDRELWVDVRFFDKHIDRLQKLSQKGVPCYAKAHPRYANFEESEIKRYETTREIIEADYKVFIGQLCLSGTFALHLAILEKYDEIYLLGYDFGNNSRENKNTHFYQDYLTDIDSTGVMHPELYRGDNDTVLPQVQDYEFFTSPNVKSKIYNVSTISNIPYFDKITSKEFFKLLNDK